MGHPLSAPLIPAEAQLKVVRASFTAGSTEAERPSQPGVTQSTVTQHILLTQGVTVKPCMVASRVWPGYPRVFCPCDVSLCCVCGCGCPQAW